MGNEVKKHPGFIKEIFALAIPAGIQQVINLLVNLTDNLMIGSLGEASISAVSLCGNYMWLAFTFVNGLASGAVIIAAQDWGNKNTKRIKQLFSLILITTVSIGFLFFFITAIFPVQILEFYSNSPEIIEPGLGYLKYVKYSFPMVAISFSTMIMLRSVRSVKLGLYNTMASCLFNVFFNWVFIYGNLGAPAMGAAGAALGTTIARFVELIVSLMYLFKFEKNLKFRIQEFNPFLEFAFLKKLFTITLPLLIIDVANSMTTTVQTMIVGRISTNYVTANSIVHMGWQIPNVFCWGVAMAASIMIGNALGANDFDKARNDTKRFLIVGICVGTFSAVALQFILPALIQFYNVTEATQVLARQMGYSASVTVFFMSLAAILCNGCIKSGGHTKRLLTIDLLANWIIAIPLGFIGAFLLKWPAPVLYLVLRAGNMIKTGWALIRLKKDDWMQNLTQ